VGSSSPRSRSVSASVLNRDPSASAVWRVLTKISVDSWSATISRIVRTWLAVVSSTASSPASVASRSVISGSRTRTSVRGDLDRLEPAVALAVRVASPGPDEEPTDLLGVADRRGEADPLERPRDAAQAFEPDRELRAALRGGELVDLVDDDVRDVL